VSSGARSIECGPQTFAREGVVYTHAMRQLAAALLSGACLVAALTGCATSPADQEATRRAWAERDAERARECAAQGRGFVAGGCAAGGP